MLGVWNYIDGRDFSDQTRNRKYECRFFGETFWIFYVQSKNDKLNNTKGDKTKVSGDWRYAGGNSLLAMLSLTGWYGLAKENIAPLIQENGDYLILWDKKTVQF